MMETIIAKLANLWALMNPSPIFNPYYEEIISLLYKESRKRTKKEPGRDFAKLAERMIGVYRECGCTGNKPETSAKWVSSPTVIKTRLESDKINLSKYSDDEIVEATRRYINVPNKKRKRTLLYFIWKEEGGFKSDLMDELATPSEEQNETRIEDPMDWLYKR